MTKKRFEITARIYDKKGKLLSVGKNSYKKTHPLQKKFADLVGLPDKIFLHAEISALSKLRKNHKPYKITIERYKSCGATGLTKPCPVCDLAIKSFGIKEIKWTE